MNTFKLQMQLDKTIFVDPKLVKKRDGKLTIDIQGELKILINDECFFLEPSLALLEFGIALKKWKREENFYYHTLEYDEREGPILAFNKMEENHWALFSIWQLYESKELLTLDRVIKAVDLFLIGLDRELLKNYGFTIDDFIKRKWVF